MITTSESLSNISKALVEAGAEMPTATLNKTNPHFRSRYADLAELVGKARPILAKHGLTVYQAPLGSVAFPADSGIEQAADSDDRCFVATVTRLIHSSGEWIQSVCSLPIEKTSPQAAGSAITYARRYSLAAALGMVAEEDDDANAATTPPVPAYHPAAKPSPAIVGREATDKIIASFAPLGIEAQALEAHVKKSASRWTQADVDALRLLYDATRAQEGGQP